MEPSESKAATVEVKVGQVWEAISTKVVYGDGESMGRHTATRTLHVLELVDRGQYGNAELGARCHVVETGRKVTIAIRRMKPGNTRGWRMVHDAP